MNVAAPDGRAAAVCELRHAVDRPVRLVERSGKGQTVQPGMVRYAVRLIGIDLAARQAQRSRHPLTSKFLLPAPAKPDWFERD